MIPIKELFHICYGNQFDFSKMEEATEGTGINFISRGSTNNGFVAKVNIYNDVEPFPANLITVTMGGSYLLASFVQPEPFYTAQNIKVLTPKMPMSLQEKLFYCAAIQHNRFRYHSHSREANSTFDNLLVPEKSEIPAWVYNAGAMDVVRKPEGTHIPLSDAHNWMWFDLGSIFTVVKGKRLTRSDMAEGSIPFVGATDSNNGITSMIANDDNLHKGNLITVSYNGSIAEAFYQPQPFAASDDINVLYPKGFLLNPFIAIFLCTIINKEKYRFNYGRKWNQEKMERSHIKLPVTSDGKPDWNYMEHFIKGLPYSSCLETIHHT